MELSFGDRKLPITVCGNKFELRFPTVKDQIKFSKEFNTIDKEDYEAQTNKTIEFISTMGLPIEECEKLSASELGELTKALLGN